MYSFLQHKYISIPKSSLIRLREKYLKFIKAHFQYWSINFYCMGIFFTLKYFHNFLQLRYNSLLILVTIVSTLSIQFCLYSSLTVTLFPINSKRPDFNFRKGQPLAAETTPVV